MTTVSRADALRSGASVYFTGMPCKRGHISQRRVAGRACIQCSIELSRIRYAELRDDYCAKRKEWTERNRERHYATNLAWQRRNPEQHRASQSKRRAVARNANGYWTKADIARLMEAQDGCCAGCRASLEDGYHVDHVMPIVLGGSNWPDNLQLLCPPCNRKKGALHPDEWRKLLEVA